MLKFSRTHLLPERKDANGFPSQSLTEFAIVLPLILLVLFIMIEIARLMHAWLAIENGARFGVRYAITGEYNPDKCPMGGCVNDSDFASARIDSIHDVAWAGSSSILRVGETEVDATQSSFFQVVVCKPKDLVQPDPDDPSSTYQCIPVENGGEPGDRVMVVVEFNHPVLTPFFSNIWPHLRLSAKRKAVVEGFRRIEPDLEPPDYIPPSPVPTNTPQKPTATYTPSLTPTPTATPTPSCDLIWISRGLRLYGEDLMMKVRNNNPMAAYLSESGFHARNVKNSPPAYLDWLGFGYSKYYIARSPDFFNPNGDVTTGGHWIKLGRRSSGWWRAEFEDASLPLAGHFSVDLIFRFDNWPVECPLQDAAYLEVRPTRTPRPTWTPGPTRTPRPTRTPWPTRTPRPTSTPGPSPTPLPTRTRRPTSTPGPTYTPAPTATPKPSNTPEPITTYPAPPD